MKKIMLLTVTLCLFCFNCAYALGSYTVVVDGGSSGSRIYLYQYAPGKANVFPVIRLVASKKTNPGISNFVDNPEKIDAYFKPLLLFIKQKLQPKTDESKVTFSFLATAGMRLYPRYQQAIVYNELTKVVRKYTKFKIKQIGTITGKREAIYNWLAVNYTFNTLDTGKTIGVLDMGGASTEIAFVAQGKTPKQEITHLHLNARVFPLYAVSYLGIGQDEIRVQYLNKPACFPVGYILPNGYYGTGNYNECIKTIVPLLNKVHTVTKIKSLIPSDMKFVAVGDFYKLSHTAIFYSKNGFTPRILHQIGSKFCQQNWFSLNQQYGNKHDLHKECFNMAFFYTLLISGYNFDGDQYFDTRQDIDWTLGVVTYEAFPVK